LLFLLTYGKIGSDLAIHNFEIFNKSHNFPNDIKNLDLSYFIPNPFEYTSYILELDYNIDELIIYYYRESSLTWKHVKVPLKEFTKEFVKLAEDYIEFIKTLDCNNKDRIRILEKYLSDVKKYYKERYGEEL